ncbi:hypothetical protein BS47DRAFT_1361235 [Hydnum rufescens UP504]|uniref:Uncharacterized protein n=1 Tax=Hydnum rufescens UP504 TaxID=1448309 RepID=A0A9P6DVB3_9AGAM|nr:hypothetical protein BS47DRAFT_1361235 [Hydnum rufescens UP504]
MIETPESAGNNRIMFKPYQIWSQVPIIHFPGFSGGLLAHTLNLHTVIISLASSRAQVLYPPTGMSYSLGHRSYISPTRAPMDMAPMDNMSSPIYSTPSFIADPITLGRRSLTRAQVLYLINQGTHGHGAGLVTPAGPQPGQLEGFSGVPTIRKPSDWGAGLQSWGVKLT